MTDKEYVKGVYRSMLNHYYDNIGKPSKYTGTIITPKMIGTLTIRFLELGGKLKSEPNEIGWEELQEVWML